MEMKRIRYKINNSVNESGFDRVRGYAVNTNLCPVKFCIRQVNTWMHGQRVFHADDFQTGWRIGAFIADTKENAAEACISYMNEKIRTGEYKKAMEKADQWQKEHDKKVRMSQR